ncbi:hypothetical protein [Ilyobacter polytropus]|jgi:hypothetical protein|uniref:Uncharacterized protein n=1 Tax=Ilyobacter polytropus (strain ATCC 51220 / DSM 2926 / LMG 16218 / CuHBu1) TaxID=572544 RepID=E3HBC0_ILYPC|nr:hypothetical protein [Ilyobacter polytropus]ADO83735.1 hypothetical protein Ilyop_1964 [Ilyobacter polytropus DSM 2926]
MIGHIVNLENFLKILNKIKSIKLDSVRFDKDLEKLSRDAFENGWEIEIEWL